MCVCVCVNVGIGNNNIRSYRGRTSRQKKLNRRAGDVFKFQFYDKPIDFEKRF